MKSTLHILSWTLGLLPETMMAMIANLAGALWWHVLRYRRRVILENLRRAFPSESGAALRRRGRRACQHLVATLLEVFRIPEYTRRGLERVVTLEGVEHLEAARSKGRGVLFLSGHLGSWELGAAGAAHAVAPVSLVVKNLGPAMDAFMTETRRGAGLEVIRAEGAVRPVIRALRRGETVVFVLDQNATRSIGVFVDFFGEAACTMTGLAVLAHRTGAAVVPAIPRRLAPGRHVMRLLPAVPWESRETLDASVRHMTQVYTRALEDAIRAQPEQWLWTHKRWRTRPKGGGDERRP